MLVYYANSINDSSQKHKATCNLQGNFSFVGNNLLKHHSVQQEACTYITSFDNQVATSLLIDNLQQACRADIYIYHILVPLSGR